MVVLMRPTSITRTSGKGLGSGNRDFFGTHWNGVSVPLHLYVPPPLYLFPTNSTPWYICTSSSHFHSDSRRLLSNQWTPSFGKFPLTTYQYTEELFRILRRFSFHTKELVYIIYKACQSELKRKKLPLNSFTYSNINIWVYFMNNKLLALSDYIIKILISSIRRLAWPNGHQIFAPGTSYWHSGYYSTNPVSGNILCLFVSQTA